MLCTFCSLTALTPLLPDKWSRLVRSLFSTSFNIVGLHTQQTHPFVCWKSIHLGLLAMCYFDIIHHSYVLPQRSSIDTLF